MNHNECHFAAQCRFGSETSTPKRVRFPAAPQRIHWLEPKIPAGLLFQQHLVNICRLRSPITVSCNAIGVTAVRALDEVDAVVRAVLQAEARWRCCGISLGDPRLARLRLAVTTMPSAAMAAYPCG